MILFINFNIMNLHNYSSKCFLKNVEEIKRTTSYIYNIGSFSIFII